MPEITREEAKRAFAGLAASHPQFATLATIALAALEDAERYRYLCEWREWPDEVEAAFDCGDKLVIDAAIDRARGV